MPDRYGFSKRCDCNFFTLTLLALLVPGGRICAGQDATAWLADRKFERQLDAEAGITLYENPVRDAIASLSRTQRICIWLDRRLDPGFEPDFTSHGTSLNVLLQRLAARLHGGVGYMKSVVYLGPVATARKLPTLVAIRTDEAKALPEEVQPAFLQRRVSHWDDLAVPRQIIEALARESRLSVVGVEHVSHDLWPAVDLPPLTFVERLSLVLAGFDLTFEIARDGSAVRIVPMPDTTVLVRTYALRGNVDRIVGGLASRFPQARLQRTGPRLQVAGSYEDHRLIARLLRGEKVQRVAVVGGEKRYSLKFENQPIGVLLTTLARQLELELVVDPRVNPLLHKRVKVQVTEVPLQQLLETALDGSGIQFQLQEKKLSLSIAE
ncbi:MAG: hypothetical protein ACC628_01230 [Pirellulaceae bacterium]